MLHGAPAPFNLLTYRFALLLLQALAEGREWHQLEQQLATVRGYKMLQVCHMIMQHTEQVLSLKVETRPLPARPTDSPAAAAPQKQSKGSHAATSAAMAEAALAEASEGWAGDQPASKHCVAVAPRGQVAGCGHRVACVSALECEARRVLAGMCEERLMPTHWLNQVSEINYSPELHHFGMQVSSEAEAFSVPHWMSDHHGMFNVNV